MKIAAFNVRNLGIKKVTDKTVVQYLTKILSRYSVVVVLEVVDKSGEAMKTLLEKLNSLRSSKKRPYLMVSSRPLGRSTYKEQFVCFYRKDEVALKACYQYPDDQPGDEDAFAREPFALHFSCPKTAVKDLVLIPVHTKPEDSLKELDELHHVVQAVRDNWGIDNVVILGDFNADGRYLSEKKELKKISISSGDYHWLIQDDVDTTSSNHNDNTYDRIVVYGEEMFNAVVPGSAKTFNFQKEFKLDDDTALSISDHYPVEVKLRTGPRKHAAPRKRKTPAVNNSQGGRKKRSAPKRKKKAAKQKGQCSEGCASPAKRRRIK